MLNKAGKTLTIFMVLVLILLVSSTSIGFFLYHKEQNMRKDAEHDRDISRDSEAKVQSESKEIKKQFVILQDKNKEADSKINNLLEEMDLNEGVRNELKKENASLKDQIASFNKAREKMFAEYNQSVTQLSQYEELLKVEQAKTKSLQTRVSQLEETVKRHANALPISPTGEKMELDKIIVTPQDGPQGIVLSVDKETEFVVCSLGLKQGVKTGAVMSIFRDNQYLGDVKATRVQDEMAAADIIPPLNGRKIHKNDLVVLKP